MYQSLSKEDLSDMSTDLKDLEDRCYDILNQMMLKVKEESCLFEKNDQISKTILTDLRKTEPTHKHNTTIFNTKLMYERKARDDERHRAI